MRKTKSYTARRGTLSATAPTKTEAKALLEKQIDYACEYRSTRIEMRFGLVIIIAPVVTGWQVTVVDPADLAALHGSHYHPCTITANEDKNAVLFSARTHAAQIAWRADVDDEKHVAAAGLPTRNEDELRRWIRFQRDHIAAKAAGCTDAGAFAYASGDPRRGDLRGAVAAMQAGVQEALR